MLIQMKDLANIMLPSSFSGLLNRLEKIGAARITEKLSLILSNKDSNRLQNVLKKLLRHSN